MARSLGGLHKGGGLVFYPDVFCSPDDLLDKFESYISAVENNPLQEATLYGTKGDIAQLDKFRTPTIQGFARYLRTTTATLKKYALQGSPWSDCFEFIDESIHSITYEAAAAGLIKENIAAKKLGLAQKIEETKTERKVVILHTPDNQRALLVEEEANLLGPGDFAQAEEVVE